LGATEVCIQGGLPRDLNGNYYAGLLSTIHSELPQLHLQRFFPDDRFLRRREDRLSVSDYLIKLKEAGLGSIPGTARKFSTTTCVAI